MSIAKRSSVVSSAGRLGGVVSNINPSRIDAVVSKSKIERGVVLGSIRVEGVV